MKLEDYFSLFPAFVAALLMTISQLFFKSGSINIVSIYDFFNIYLILGLFFFGLASLLFLYSLKKTDLTVVYPVMSTYYVWSILASPFFFSDEIGLSKVSGVIIIIFGVYLVSKGEEVDN